MSSIQTGCLLKSYQEQLSLSRMLLQDGRIFSYRFFGCYNKDYFLSCQGELYGHVIYLYTNQVTFLFTSMESDSQILCLLWTLKFVVVSNIKLCYSSQIGIFRRSLLTMAVTTFLCVYVTLICINSWTWCLNGVIFLVALYHGRLVWKPGLSLIGCRLFIHILCPFIFSAMSCTFWI